MLGIKYKQGFNIVIGYVFLFRYNKRLLVIYCTIEYWGVIERVLSIVTILNTRNIKAVGEGYCSRPRINN